MNFDYYLTGFTHLLFGKNRETEYIYPVISEFLEKTISRKKVPSSQILGNIRCLYHLLSQQKKPDEILEENMLLIDMSNDYKRDAVCSILLLNRARLFRSLEKLDMAEEALYRSHEIINCKELWKQSFYYVLQLSLLKKEKKQILDLCTPTNKSSDIHQDCFGWRVAKLFTGETCYAYGFYFIPQKVRDILSSKESLKTKYELISGIDKKTIYSF